MLNNPSNFDEDKDAWIIQDSLAQLESDPDTTIIQAYKPKPDDTASTLDDASLIQKFARGERDLVSNENLQIDFCFNRLQLTSRRLEILALIDLLDKPRVVLIKKVSKYSKLINEIILENHFVPWGESSRKGFIKYQQCVPPAGYKLNYTEAVDLWKTWWPNHRQHNKHEIELDILVFFKTNWYPIKEVVGSDGNFYIKTLAGEMTLHSTDKVVWVTQISKQITPQPTSLTSPAQPERTATAVNTEADNKPIVSRLADYPSLGSSGRGRTEQQGKQAERGRKINNGYSMKVDKKDDLESMPAPQTEIQSSPEPELEEMLKIVKKKAMQTLANYLVNGVTENTTEEMKNERGEIICTKTITVKKACPQWVIKLLLDKTGAPGTDDEQLGEQLKNAGTERGSRQEWQS